MKALLDAGPVTALSGAALLLGSFDGMHRGHMALVQAGRGTSRPLAVMQCNPHPRVFFGSAKSFRISTGVAQQMLLRNAGADLIYAPRFDAAFASVGAAEFIGILGAMDVAAVVIGRDFRFGCGRKGDVGLLQQLGPSLGIEVICVDDQTDGKRRISSSDVRDAIREGRIFRATGLLGHRWLTAIHPGWHFDDDQLLPPDGRYAVKVMDAAGRPLGQTVLHLEGRQARMDAEGPVAMIGWNSDREG